MNPSFTALKEKKSHRAGASKLWTGNYRVPRVTGTKVRFVDPFSLFLTICKNDNERQIYRNYVSNQIYAYFTEAHIFTGKSYKFIKLV